MLTRLNKLRDTMEDGFTLIELLIVVVIIGILAAIAIPIFVNQQKAATDSKTASDVHNAVIAVQTALISDPFASAFNSTSIARIKSNFTPSEGTVLTITGTPADWCLKAYNTAGSQYNQNAGPYYMFVSAKGQSGNASVLGSVSSNTCGTVTGSTTNSLN